MLVGLKGGNVTPNPPSGFKACEDCGLILWLGLPVCCNQASLPYLWLQFQLHLPTWGAGVGIADCLLLFSA